MRDLTGQTINGIYVKGPDSRPGGAGKKKYWLCICPVCKKEFSVRVDHLIDEKHPKTMCGPCKRTQREDLTGQKFHFLTVNYMLPVEKYERSKCSCTCDCGTTSVVVQANHLKNGEIKSCGCLKSYGEERIAEILAENHVAFEKQKRFPGLVYTNVLRCDFYLPDFNLVIEYNGEQHYKPVKLYGGEENLKITQARDKAKKDYCIEHGINYLVIKFDEDIEEALIKNNIVKRDSLASTKVEG